jgi:hypothetical protein
MNSIKIFSFNDQEIEFDLSDNNIMVDATAMGKVFGKLPGNFLKTESTEKFIEFMMFRYSLKNNDIVRTSTNGGTWMHRKLALKFAAWLSVEFEDWVYTIIEKLLVYRLNKINQINIKRVNLKKSIAEKEAKYMEAFPDFLDYLLEKRELIALGIQMKNQTQPDSPELGFE